ncbi:MAG: SHOCT domain-containing protein [Nitrospirota bacterium]|nr:SHOCT domain-containing protein [Nitrospirota bacterium]
MVVHHQASTIGLATLKRLKEQHLITEEDYQRKKQALLDQL